jgi:hypothetical protein
LARLARADMADRVPVAGPGGGQHLGHLLAEGAELGRPPEAGHPFFTPTRATWM